MKKLMELRKKLEAEKKAQQHYVSLDGPKDEQASELSKDQVRMAFNVLNDYGRRQADSYADRSKEKDRLMGEDRTTHKNPKKVQYI